LWFVVSHRAVLEFQVHAAPLKKGIASGLESGGFPLS
jgi:hypothetical protein